jgi:hypothetical protein
VRPNSDGENIQASTARHAEWKVRKNLAAAYRWVANFGGPHAATRTLGKAVKLTWLALLRLLQANGRFHAI